jgi:tRNA-dihydrouridine synthase C
VKYCPELINGGKTTAGVPVFIQLLGGQVEPMAANAFRVFHLGAPGLDLNFGCPAKTVNRHDGGATLLKNPDRLFNIISAIRKAVPKDYPVTAKVRLGFEDKSKVLEISRAASEGGADRLTVHARTKIEGYKPPAHWEFIAQMREVSTIPVVANGDIWTVEDYIKCVEVSGCADVALGRCLMAKPDLALAIKANHSRQNHSHWGWSDMFLLIERFYQRNVTEISELYAQRRLKQLLKMVMKSFPDAKDLFEKVKRLHTEHEIQSVLSDYSESLGEWDNKVENPINKPAFSQPL